MGHNFGLDNRCDVVVVGGGIIGCTAAYYLAKKGFNVILLESGDLASGATGHNIGYIFMHTRNPGPQLDLANATRQILPDLPDELDYDFELRQNGGMIYFNREQQVPIMQEFVEQRNKDGITMQLLDKKEALEMAPLLPENTLGSTYCPMDSLVNPTLYVRAFANAARRHGALIRTGIEVISVNTDGPRVTGVKTAEGDIESKYVVLAAGGWTTQLTEKLGLKFGIFSMRLQLMTTAPLTERLLDKCLYGPDSAKQYKLFQDLPSYDDEAFRADYEWRYETLFLQCANQMKSGNMLFGIPMDYPAAIETANTADTRGVGLMAEAMYANFPALRTAEIDRAWGRVVPFTSDSLPVIDFVSEYDGLIINSGHTFGNATGPISGILTAEMIAGEKTSIDISPFSLKRPALESLARTW
jgi:sarcosine oxidase subunit beta